MVENASGLPSDQDLLLDESDEASAARSVPVADVDVLIVGAGPTGLTAAIDAVRHGLTVRIVDRKASRSEFSKALVTHARTLEVFETMGIAEAILAEGVPFAALNPHTGARRRRTRVDLLNLPWGDTAYPFWLSIPQYATERVLEDNLRGLGVTVDWNVRLEDLEDRGDHVQAHLEHRGDVSEVVRSRWLIGCDGGRSRVRNRVGLHLDRESSGVTFILADVKTTTSLPEDEGHVFLGSHGLLLIVPMPEAGRWRIIAHEPMVTVGSPRPVDAAYLDELILDRAGLEFGCHDVTWNSRFELSHGVATRYRIGRVFLAGDAAHVHSPVGGQGLNAGVQDAHNLVWKLGLARALPTEATEALLDSYEAERRAVAGAMVDGISKITGLLTRTDGILHRLIGVMAPRILASSRIRAKLGRTVGMLEIAYRHGRLVAGHSPRSGRRMPNPVLPDGRRLYEVLDRVHPTWIVQADSAQGLPEPGAAAWRGLPTITLPAEPAAAHDIAPVVLVRPDRYIAGADRTPDAVWSSTTFGNWTLHPRGEQMTPTTKTDHARQAVGQARSGSNEDGAA